MARVVVFGASGRIGQPIVDEAIRRGHQVTAVARRDEAKLAKLSKRANATAGDATSRDAVHSLADGADAVVVAVGGNDKKVWANSSRAMIDALTKLGDSAPRLVHIGHGGTLEDGQGARICDDPQFPNGMRKDALGQAEALELLRSAKGVTVDRDLPAAGPAGPEQAPGHLPHRHRPAGQGRPRQHGAVGRRPRGGRHRRDRQSQAHGPTFTVGY